MGAADGELDGPAGEDGRRRAVEAGDEEAGGQVPAGSPPATSCPSSSDRSALDHM